MKRLNALLQKYSYAYPKELIAEAPAHPRDSARLLVYDRKTKKISEDTFAQLASYMPERAVMVFNQTKVIPARLVVTKDTGGKVELLYTGMTKEGMTALANKKLTEGMKLFVDAKHRFVVGGGGHKEYVLVPQFPRSQVQKILDTYGLIPLPPYLRHSKLSEQRRKIEYQTVFGKKRGAVAAPTASLHFTASLLGKLKRRGITSAFVTLHVGLGTFAPLTEEAVVKKQLHHEYYEIDMRTARLLNEAKKQGRPIIAVGTTVVRTLESAVNSRGVLTALSGNTNLFIQESTKLKFVDSIITNFHVPSSSLLMLVAAFVGRKKLLDIYKYAVQKKYRLFSFGDGMYIK